MSVLSAAATLCAGAIGAVCLLLLITRHPQLRLVVFISGAMLVMQSSDGISAGKFGYLALALICWFVSLIHIRKLKTTAWWPAAKSLIIGANILMVIIGLTVLGSLLYGTSASQVARDALTYVMIAIAPVIGLDAASTGSPKIASVLTVIFSGAASISFAVYWLSQRGVSTLPIDRVVMWSMMLAGLGAITGIVRGLSPRLHLSWLLFGIFCLACILITGTRTGLILVVAVAGAVGHRRHYRVPPVRLVAGVLSIAALMYVALPWISARVASASFFGARLATLSDALRGGFSNDPSGLIRDRAYAYALTIWRSHPLLGVGFGYSFPNPNPAGGTVDFQLDTPLLYLAKFGLLGTIGILIALTCFALTPRRMRRVLNLTSTEQTIYGAFAFLWLLILPFGTPTEDKGFGLALCLLCFMLGARAERACHQCDTQENVGIHSGFSQSRGSRV